MARVLLFGMLGDAAGWRERTLAEVPATLSALRALLSAETPRLAEALARPGVQAAVDKTLARGDVALTQGCEVAFLPPMSGG
ncbi:MoaD/ThiS family protein [Caulobacter sp. S45]|jgi:molybdopterin synthase sulfur carrier subunit|uniref:MoaD/ThiS family protein n=1 Tax=Caulobacter sp. S45 TaxID=1641861 RepID=UPI00131D805B|nr:MoaD/ThiS family protein [Caulobacter sp. S45]